RVGQMPLRTVGWVTEAPVTGAAVTKAPVTGGAVGGGSVAACVRGAHVSDRRWVHLLIIPVERQVQAAVGGFTASARLVDVDAAFRFHGGDAALTLRNCSGVQICCTYQSIPDRGCPRPRHHLDGSGTG